MARIKRAQSRKNRKHYIRRWVKGFFGGRKRYRQARQAVIQAQRYSFAGRKQRKRQFRRLWISRISAALMPHRLSYSRFIHGLKVANIDLNRKSLAALALHEPETFNAVVSSARQALGV